MKQNEKKKKRVSIVVILDNGLGFMTIIFFSKKYSNNFKLKVKRYGKLYKSLNRL